MGAGSVRSRPPRRQGGRACRPACQDPPLVL